MQTDKHWQIHAKKDPYWAVVTWDRFKGDIANNPELFEEFLNTGRSYINSIFEIIRSAIDPAFQPQTALDFGCGVGRLLLPIAERGIIVSGVDISEGMLQLTKQHLHSRNLQFTDLSLSLDQIPKESRYDLVHTFIVLQHIPKKRGLEIVDQLLDRVSEQGVIVFHVTYSPHRHSIDSIRRTAVNVAKDIFLRFSPFSSLYRILKKQDFTPPMLMENYPLNAIFSKLGEHLFNNIHIRHSLHGNHKGLLIFAQRSNSISHPGHF